MLTVGVDLGAEPKRTAVATLEWSDDRAVVQSIRLGATDETIIGVSRSATAIGIDCPLGWPVEFVDFLVAHRRQAVAPRELAGNDWRRRLAYRETDRVVREVANKWPLSVSTDRLGLTAMRCAELLEAFSAAGEFVDRSGSGRLVEVYPGAALRLWGVSTTGYKGASEACARATAELQRLAPWRGINDASLALMSRSDDAFDAVVAALNARAHALGDTLPVPDELVMTAQAEGWIALPTKPLDALVGRALRPPA